MRIYIWKTSARCCLEIFNVYPAAHGLVACSSPSWSWKTLSLLLLSYCPQFIFRNPSRKDSLTHHTTAPKPHFSCINWVEKKQKFFPREHQDVLLTQCMIFRYMSDLLEEPRKYVMISLRVTALALHNSSCTRGWDAISDTYFYFGDMLNYIGRASIMTITM